MSETIQFEHKSVLLNECIDGLHINPEGIYVDGTVGGAGHSKVIASKLKSGRLICLDKDPDAVKVASQRLRPYKNATVVESEYSQIDSVMEKLQISSVNGILLDLGVSSYQLDTAERGFSYNVDSPLDMRMSKKGISARDVVNTYPLNELERIIREYSEERFSYKIASLIVKEREKAPIETTMQLSKIIHDAVPAFSKRDKNPDKRTFQAIRMEVNKELENLSVALDKCFDLLLPGGRLAVITFHSLEDRMVKQRFKSYATGCTCPPDFPVCVCGKKPRGALVTRKAIEPTQEELGENRRSKSARLRIIEKL